MSQIPDTILHQLKQRPTQISVNLAALQSNLQLLRQRAGSAKVLASVKADAYGHGLIPCCRALAEAGVDYFGVAFVEEGLLLREAGIATPILIFGGLSSDQIEIMLEYNLDITASSVDKLLAIDAVAGRVGKQARVHLKIDTGMERIGIHHYSARSLLQAGEDAKHCVTVGVYSHFASSDSLDLTFARLQLQRFKEVIAFYSNSSAATPMFHMANSAALLQLPESHFDMVRPGIALFGCAPAPHLKAELSLLPVLSLQSKVVYFKVVKAGSSVSYGGTWTASEDTRIVTVPIGYGDGFSRANSNKGFVLIRGKRYPIVGTVCMDQLMVNIGHDEAFNGDDVVLIGTQGDQQISAQDVAEATGTISYEVLAALKLRIPRVYQSSE